MSCNDSGRPIMMQFCVKCNIFQLHILLIILTCTAQVCETRDLLKEDQQIFTDGVIQSTVEIQIPNTSISIASNHFNISSNGASFNPPTSQSSYEPIQGYSTSNPLITDPIEYNDVMGFFENIFATRGAWFNVLDWAAATNMCIESPESTACMSCSMNMPKFALQQNIAAFGVSDLMWAFPEAGATCGMCLKILLPPGKECKQFSESDPFCVGQGSSPYSEFSSRPWAWSSPSKYDSEIGLNYIVGIVVEWYDLDVPLPYGISYLTKGKDPQGMGSWPVQITAIECPIEGYNMEYAFVDYENEELNLYNKKLQIAGHRMPIVNVKIRLGGRWYPMKRSGNRDDGGYPDSDGHWESPGGIAQALGDSLDLEIQCAGTSKLVQETDLVPARMMCKYQDPRCVRFVGFAQC